MKTKLLITFLLILTYGILSTQVTKLPLYAIQKLSYVDAIRDTAGTMYGAQLVNNDSPYEYIDSILFKYNSNGKLEKETIWRFPGYFEYNILDSTGRNAVDTCRHFREHRYDSLGRKVSIRHGYIYGSPHRSNINNYQPYPNGGPEYFSVIHKIDSIAYDNHGNKIFQRRYEMFDFTNQNFDYVIRPTHSEAEIEIEYEYDQLGRKSKETHYKWVMNNKEIKTTVDASTKYQFSFKYIGNTNKLSSRSYEFFISYFKSEFNISDPIMVKDSLFRYDTLGRITGSGWFGWPKKDVNNNVYISYDEDKTKEPSSSFIDSTIYFDTQGSFQHKFHSDCAGKQYYKDGRLHFTFSGDIDTNRSICKSKMWVNAVNRYSKDNEGNILSRDSAYYLQIYTDGNLTPTDSRIVFDTVNYYDFRNIGDLLTTYRENTNLSIDFELYPNPASDQVKILCKSSGRLLIYNSYGDLVLNNFIKQSGPQELDISGFKSGIYVLRFDGISKKLIVH